MRLYVGIGVAVLAALALWIGWSDDFPQGSRQFPDNTLVFGDEPDNTALAVSLTSGVFDVEARSELRRGEDVDLDALLEADKSATVDASGAPVKEVASGPQDWSPHEAVAWEYTRTPPAHVAKPQRGLHYIVRTENRIYWIRARVDEEDWVDGSAVHDLIRSADFASREADD